MEDNVLIEESLKMILLIFNVNDAEIILNEIDVDGQTFISVELHNNGETAVTKYYEKSLFLNYLGAYYVAMFNNKEDISYENIVAFSADSWANAKTDGFDDLHAFTITFEKFITTIETYKND